MSDTLRGILLIVVAGTIVYANSLSNGFTFDDHAIVESHPATQSLDIPAIWSSPYWPNGWRYGLYRPVTLTSFALINVLFGTDPTAHHVVNLVLHLGSALLVFVVAQSWLKIPGATAAGLLFVLHPVQTEAVNAVVGRADLLATVLSLTAWQLYRRDGSLSRIGSILAFGFALLSKESAVVLPGILVLDDWSRYGVSRVRTAWTRYFPYAGLVVALLLVRVSVVGSFVLPELPRLVDNPLAHVSTGTRLLTAVAILGRYIGLILAPVSLSPDYTYDQIPSLTSPLDPWFGAGFLLLIGIAWVARTALPILPAFGLLLFAGSILPVSNIPFVVGTNMAERLLYLPMVGVALSVGWLFQAGVGSLRAGAVWVTALVLVLLMGSRTFNRNPEWKDDLALFGAAVETSALSAKVNFNYGAALSDAGEVDAAHRAYERALHIYSEYAELYYNRGLLWQTEGDLANARRAYETALRYDSTHVGTWVNAGVVEERIGKSGMERFRRALDLDPNRVDARFNYGVALRRRGDRVNGAAALRRVLEQVPSHEDATIELANLYREAGHTDSAIVVYGRLLRIRPNAYRAAYNLGVELERIGQWDRGLIAYGLASGERSERGAFARYRAGVIFERSGRVDSARVAFRDYLKWSAETAPHRTDAKSRLERLRPVPR